jgi:acyl carrier protein
MEERMDVNEGVLKVVCEQFDKPQAVAVDSTTLSDLDADSLDVVELVMGLEEEFDVEISDDEAADKFTESCTVSDLRDFITAKLDAKEG